MRAAAMKVRQQNDPLGHALTSALVIGVLFAVLLTVLGFFLVSDGMVAYPVLYVVLSLAGCALLGAAVYRLALRDGLRLVAEGALPPAADPYHVVMAEDLVDRGALGWHPWVNRHGYVLAGQRLREFGVRYPGRTITLRWTGALAVLALIALSLVWDDAALPPANLILGSLGGAGFALGALTHRSIARKRRESAEAFREEYEAWGASGDPAFPGFPDRG
ncbi:MULTISPECIES: hypothetical protein [unclassified Nocardiopsis]|uniref:hypothetical protein n=1 Tax=Nocardiopsis TaxID=2013 RepID=UPI00387AC79D